MPAPDDQWAVFSGPGPFHRFMESVGVSANIIWSVTLPYSFRNAMARRSNNTALFNENRQKFARAILGWAEPSSADYHDRQVKHPAKTD